MAESKWRRYHRVTGPDLDADIRDEIEFHLQTIIDKYVARGLTADAARIRAVADFGDVASAREACMEIGESQQRQHQRAERLGNLRQDIRHAARRLAKNPAFTVVTVLTLAIGLGPNIAIFNIIDSVLLKPLPYKNPDQLVGLAETFQLQGRSGSGSVSGPNFADWRAQNRTFSVMSVSTATGSANLGDPAQPERLTTASIDAAAFPMLGVSPLRGRFFRDDETRPGGQKVVILGETLWRRKYLGDESIVGRRIKIDGEPTEVVGIMPANIIFPNRSSPMDAWLPFQADLTQNRGNHGLRVFGRLEPGVTEATAANDMNLVAARLRQAYPDNQEGRGIAITPLSDLVINSARQQLAILLGAAALVLLIACANAASLLIARAASRTREVALLAAIGASRGRVIQQFLVESLLISVVASIMALVLSIVVVKGILVSAGTIVPRTTEIHTDGSVALFVVAAILVTTLVCGIVPALRATKTDLQSSLREGNRGGNAGAGFRSGLVVGQFALSLVLLVGAGLLLRTFEALMHSETGIKPDRVITMHLPFPVGSPRYPTADVGITHFHEPLLAELRATPGVEAAGMTSLIPLQSFGVNGNFYIDHQSYASIKNQPFAEIRMISPGYFATLGIPLRGRDFVDADRAAAAQVVIINDELARTYFPGVDPIGHNMSSGSSTPGMTIVGVVASVKEAGIDQKVYPTLFAPYGQMSWGLGDMGLLIRTRGDPAAIVKTVQADIRKLDPDQPIYSVKTMREIASDSVAARRLYLRLLAAFASVALFLAMAGIYGVISYAVTQRTREFGIRIALGSETPRIKRMVIWDGARLALLGLAIGLPGAFLTTRLIQGILYGVQRADPITYGAVALILCLVSLVACYMPARRAVRVDPIIAMRAE
jgi:putative ABC transport system permease protein